MLISSLIAASVPAAEMKKSRATADLKRIAEALRLYRADAGRYPSTEAGLRAVTPHLANIPPDPWGRPYLFTSYQNDRVRVWTFGADGREGGTNEDADIDKYL